MANSPLVAARIGILGLGLMGGSLALALKQRGLCETVIGYARREQTREKALALGVVDKAVNSLSELVQADIVVICTPLGTYEALFKTLAQHWRAGLILTDVGSVKARVSELAAQYLPEVNRFVPGHPIAGSEQSGLEAALANLFVDHRVILTPTEQTEKIAYDAVRRMWVAVGAQVTTMGLLEHDRILAATSHLPHVLAFSLVDTLAGDADNQEIFRYAAGGFRDFTRIAESDPVMWKDICDLNRLAILESIDQFQVGLEKLTQDLKAKRDQEIFQRFSRAQSARRHFSKLLARRADQQGKDFMDQHTCFLVSPNGQLTGDIRVPGDKSISHRSIILGAIAEGTTVVKGLLEGEDVLATLSAFQKMGVKVERPVPFEVVIQGVGLKGLKAPSAPLYLGNSGTSIRLIAGILSAQSFATTLEGDASLSKRPMQRIAKPLSQMGAALTLTDAGTAPIKLAGRTNPLTAVEYVMPQASAQVKSAVLLAGLYAQGLTQVVEPALTRDHTERMLKAFGYEVEVQGNRIALVGGGCLKATNIQVPADISSAAFFMVGASIAKGSDICLQQVGINPTRIGVLNILKAMGADIKLTNESTLGAEPVADIRVRSASLTGIDIPLDQVPLAIDEFPAIFIAAACAKGITRLRGAAELRVKESDRIQAMANGLEVVGIRHQVVEDGIDIWGGPAIGGEINSEGDHRIAMSFAMLGLVAQGNILIKDCENVATSFPGFVELAQSAGLDIAGR